MTVNGTGGLSNTGEINIEGSATVQSTLNVANAAAGFGTAGVETGTVFLQNDALLEFKSGQIRTVDGALWLDGANARVADAGALDHQQRADRPDHRFREFLSGERRDGQRRPATLSVTGNGTLELDGNNNGGAGGSSLTVGGTLTNSSTNSNGVSTSATPASLRPTL